MNKHLASTLLPFGCKSFGSGASFSRIQRWKDIWRDCGSNFDYFLVLAGSKTAEIEGISAAGSTPQSRRYTAVADAELVLYGPDYQGSWPLPPLPAGVSPALISYVGAKSIGVTPLVFGMGLTQQADISFPEIEPIENGPAECLTTGKAMTIQRVERLWRKGLSIGLGLHQPLLLAECVPGGTTTAQAVMTGLGLPVSGVVSSSSRRPPQALKEKVVKRGLLAARLKEDFSSQELIAAIGDPFQPFATGLLLGARAAGQEVLLGGGSQMLAVLSLALNELTESNRSKFAEGICIGTTAWLAEECLANQSGTSSFGNLIDLVGNHFDVNLLGLSAGLRFFESNYQLLRDYELGYVKEGVGAGALALLAQLQGNSLASLLSNCETALSTLQSKYLNKAS